MRDIGIDVMIGLVILAVGIMVGYSYSKPEPPTKEILSEIKALQTDVIRIETQGMKNFIKIEDLDKWRDSIMFRPPELPIKKKKKEVK